MLWFGGKGLKGLPYLVWEKNGPGLTLGKRIVQEFRYPRYHRTTTVGAYTTRDPISTGGRIPRSPSSSCSRSTKRALMYGDIINHSDDAMEEAKRYVNFGDGSVGPAGLVEESSTAKKTHGDRVMADALTLLKKGKKRHNPKHEPPPGSAGHRKKNVMRKKRENSGVGWRHKFDSR